VLTMVTLPVPQFSLPGPYFTLSGLKFKGLRGQDLSFARCPPHWTSWTLCLLCKIKCELACKFCFAPDVTSWFVHTRPDWKYLSFTICPTNMLQRWVGFFHPPILKHYSQIIYIGMHLQNLLLFFVTHSSRFNIPFG